MFHTYYFTTDFTTYYFNTDKNNVNAAAEVIESIIQYATIPQKYTKEQPWFDAEAFHKRKQVFNALHKARNNPINLTMYANQRNTKILGKKNNKNYTIEAEEMGRACSQNGGR